MRASALFYVAHTMFSHQERGGGGVRVSDRSRVVGLMHAEGDVALTLSVRG